MARGEGRVCLPSNSAIFTLLLPAIGLPRSHFKTCSFLCGAVRNWAAGTGCQTGAAITRLTQACSVANCCLGGRAAEDGRNSGPLLHLQLRLDVVNRLRQIWAAKRQNQFNGATTITAWRILISNGWHLDRSLSRRRPPLCWRSPAGAPASPRSPRCTR